MGDMGIGAQHSKMSVTHSKALELNKNFKRLEPNKNGSFAHVMVKKYINTTINVSLNS